MMTPEQIQQLLQALREIAAQPKSYTLTGASDWPLLVVVGTALVALICFMWLDLRTQVRDGRGEWQRADTELETRIEKETALIWKAIKECQDDCCPRGKRGV